MNAANRHATTMASMRHLYSGPETGQKKAPAIAVAEADETKGESKTPPHNVTAHPKVPQALRDAGAQWWSRVANPTSGSRRDILRANSEVLRIFDRWVGDLEMVKIREMLEGDRAHG